MAGHNKWSKVKHIKARVDVVKGRVFSKCAHEIALAARSGGGDPGMNARLRSAIDNAKAVSMPKDNIERAIKKGLGELGGNAIQEVTYEAYGPGATAFIIEMATDNLNRSAADLRTILTKNDGSIATPGSVTYQFDRCGEIHIAADGITADEFIEIAINAGADDAFPSEDAGDDPHVMLTPPTTLASAATRLRAANIPIQSEKLVYRPQTVSVVDDLDTARRVMKLHDLFDDYQDTLAVFTNFDVAEELLPQLDD
jgi:YebC/PmpR family DNA-binding regulatory protein